MRVLCVLMPHFCLRCEIQRRPALRNRPALVTCNAGSRRLVLDYSPELTAMQRGMSLQEALARHGDAELVPADTRYYQAAFDSILDSLEQISPLVEGSDPGCAYLGLDGLEHLYSSDAALVDTVAKAIPGTFETRTGIAGGKFIAYLAALYSSPEPDTFWKDLPSNILPVSRKSKQKLQELGLRTLGQIAALLPGPVQAQFGPEGKKMWELARGVDNTPLYPRQKKENIEVSFTLPSMAVSLEAILAAVELLLAMVFIKDAVRGKGIRRLTLWAQLWGAGYWERGINFKEPATSPRSAFSRIKHVVESYPPPGPVEELGLRITGIGYERGHQGSLFSEVRAREQLREDIAQMELRMGGPQVFTVKEVEPWSRIPERRRVLTPLSR